MADETMTADAPKDNESAVNTQITDSLQALQEALQVGAGQHAAAMAELARVQATAMKDFQAVARQQSDGTIMSATATAAVAKMMSVPFTVGGLGTGVVALAQAQGAAAITTLQTLRETAGDGEAAAAALDQLRQMTAYDPPASPAPPQAAGN